MIPRYSRPEMAKIWEPENKFQKWLDVEIAACEAWAELGEIPKKSLATIKKKAKFSIKRIDKIELKVKHDVIAFLTSVAENVGPDSRYIHKGLTSSDIGDTALALLMREAADIIIQDIKDIMKVLKTNARKYKKTLQMGRSHGIHAEPTTFGLTFTLWYEEMKRNLVRMETARETINYGQLSGPVGTFTSLPMSIEKYVCKSLKLKVDPIVTQVIQRDRHAEYMNTLALIAGAIEKMAVEMRHLQRTEVLEAEEPFAKGQKGSSAMPHKRNPIGSENLSGLARIVRSNTIAAMENMPLWHERDISHSSVERVIIPDSTILINYMLKRMTGILAGIQVYPQRMKENIGKSYGLFCSQRVMIRLTENGMSREDAYAVVQARAMEAWKEKVPYKDLLKKDKIITKYLSDADIESLFDMDYYTKNIDFIYKRVFGAPKKKKKK